MDTKSATWLCAFLALAVAASPGYGQMTAKEKNSTLDYLNHLRRNVVPPSGDMNGLLWDTNLENLAQKAADSCVFAHNYGGEYANLGEILYLGARSNMSEILVFMFLEREIYNHTNGACTSGAGKYPFFSTCGHYLQMATATVNKVGCGIKLCGSNYMAACEFDRSWYSPPYQVGEPGTKCGNSFATYFKDGLCYSIMYGQEPPIPGPFECKLKCLNYGTLIKEPFCSCTCPPGFFGMRCETKNIYYTANTTPNDCTAQGVNCKNGGTPTMFDTKCKCVCEANFEGSECEVNKVQESHSLAIYYGGEMRYASYYPLHMSIWNATLKQTTRSHLTDAINAFCSANFATCCPSSASSALPSGIEYFATCDDFHVTDNYPLQVLDGSMRADVYYTMQANVATACNGNTQQYISKSVLTAAWPNALSKVNASIASVGLHVIRAE